MSIATSLIRVFFSKMLCQFGKGLYVMVRRLLKRDCIVYFIYVFVCAILVCECICASK